MKTLNVFDKANMKKGFNELALTDPKGISELILRLTIGSVMFAHGAQKLLGWFGGYGFANTITYLTTSVDLPWAIAFLVILIEFFGGLSLIAGFFTRLMAMSITAVMLGAIVAVHWTNGFFMDWNNSMNAEGFEYHLLAIAIAAVLILKGGGMWSVDSFLFTKNDDNKKHTLNTGNNRLTKVDEKSIEITVRSERLIIK